MVPCWSAIHIGCVKVKVKEHCSLCSEGPILSFEPLWDIAVCGIIRTFLIIWNCLEHCSLWNCKNPSCHLKLFRSLQSVKLQEPFLIIWNWGSAAWEIKVWFLLFGCPASEQHANVFQGWICTDTCMCCYTQIEVADQTFFLTQSQYTDIGLTSPGADPITPDTWQGSHWRAHF